MAFLAVLLLSALGVGAMLEWQTFQSKNQVAKQTTTPKKTNKRTAHTGRRRRSTAVSARENDDYTVRSGSYHETVSNSGSDTPKKGTGKPAPSHSPEKADGAGADGTTPDASDGAGTSSAVETTSDASIAPDTVERGGPATISATINTRGGSLSDVVVAVEVYNASGVKIGQQHWTGQSLSANQSRVYTWTWTAPENAGTYTVKIGVFGPDRTPEYHWNENAATITIQ